MRKFATPLRLTWDWDWPPVVHPGSPPRRPAAETVREIGAEIVRAGVLLLEVGYPDPEALRSGELTSALEGFAGSISLVLAPAAAAALTDSRPWEAPGVGHVWLDATPVSGVLAAGLEGWPFVRFYLTAGNLEAAATGIERALAAGAAAISLPNLPLFGEPLRDPAAAPPTVAQLAVFGERIAAAFRGRSGVDLRVHHYGLWQQLSAAGVQPHGEADAGAGCQAGSALGYVDPAGVLHPCASLPIPLARVAEGAIRAAWSGAEIVTLRGHLAALPARCSGCPAATACRGGCRGWAHYLHHTWTATGPDCTRQ
ncbi:MAG TPA: SPASM domain-containing protein [Candidatus Methanoperedens sp.]|nr:SPASM domain-containing protein [Candidatus Methanoperedens sp.]